MSKRSRGQSASGKSAATWLTLQTELAGYQDGVHWLTDPTDAALLAAATERLTLPGPLVELYRRFASVRLFLDSHEIVAVDAIERDGEWLRIGQSLGGAVFCASDGSVRVEGDEGETLCAAMTPFGWLGLVAERERLVFDKEGEFRDVFDEQEEGEFVPAIRKKRAELGRKLEPKASQYAFDLALLALDAGDEATALDEAELAIELDPFGVPALELVASMREPTDASAASALWAQAGRAARSAARAADALGWSAVLAGDVHPEHASRATAALTRDPECVARWLKEADEQLAAREGSAAQRLAKLAQAVARTEDDRRRATQILLRSSLRAI